jgi:hypothetical protein
MDRACGHSNLRYDDWHLGYNYAELDRQPGKDHLAGSQFRD